MALRLQAHLDADQYVAGSIVTLYLTVEREDNGNVGDEDGSVKDEAIKLEWCAVQLHGHQCI